MVKMYNGKPAPAIQYTGKNDVEIMAWLSIGHNAFMDRNQRFKIKIDDKTKVVEKNNWIVNRNGSIRLLTDQAFKSQYQEAA